jgi:hypothetical protein
LRIRSRLLISNGRNTTRALFGLSTKPVRLMIMGAIIFLGSPEGRICGSFAKTMEKDLFAKVVAESYYQSWIV